MYPKFTNTVIGDFQFCSTLQDLIVSTIPEQPVGGSQHLQLADMRSGYKANRKNMESTDRGENISVQQPVQAHWS